MEAMNIAFWHIKSVRGHLSATSEETPVVVSTLGGASTKVGRNGEKEVDVGKLGLKCLSLMA